ncbi:CLUMA_CG005027, isoform A [Clunio marinus]|uniref:CLUMA_CG005027, isoform A n=1 Tax=Clunio marinus TaxID=568069 RepID=A0A1J1HUY5_9DIPT|nr:CLUMA_CG005027, isoform A [Clunio marinus]
MVLIKFLTVFLSLITLSICANILAVFELPYYSHQSFPRTLMKELALRGHHLTILSSIPYEYNNSNVTQIHLKEGPKVYGGLVNQLLYKKISFPALWILNELNAHSELTKENLKSEEVQNLIRNAKKNDFDLLLIECVDVCPMLAFAELYDCPAIVSTAFAMPFMLLETLGNDVNPVIHPESIACPLMYGNLSLFERLQSFFFYIGHHWFAKHFFNLKSYFHIKKYFPNLNVSQKQLEERIAFIFSNTLTNVRPFLPNTIETSFMQIEIPKPLPEGDLKTFLDDSEEGIILMSLGSYTESKDLDTNVVDVFRNPSTANTLVRKGVAVNLDLFSLNEEKLRNAIFEIVKLKYKRNIQELRRQIHDQPMSGLEKAVWYTEFVIRNKGAKFLTYPARDVPFYKQHHYDILLIISFAIYLTFKALKAIMPMFPKSHSMSPLTAKKSD